METSRRGFFKWLGGASVAVVPAALGSYAMGVDTAVGPEKTMFNFTCACGEGHSAEVPKNIGAFHQFDCICGTHWKMEWMGDHFKTEMSNPKNENEGVLEKNVYESIANPLKGLSGRPNLPSVADEDYEWPPLD